MNLNHQVTQVVLDIDILVVADSIQADNRPGPYIKVDAVTLCLKHQARWKTSRECVVFQHDKLCQVSTGCPTTVALTVGCCEH